MARKRRVIVAHGWNDHPTNGWVGWLCRELERRGFEVVAPAFPRPHLPQPGEWVRVLKEAVGRLNSRTVMVGYSLGAPTTMRVLNDYPRRVQLAGLVTVSGFGSGFMHRPKVFFEPSLDFERLRERARVRVCIYSDNDHIVFPKQSQLLADNLAAESIVLPGRGHFISVGHAPDEPYEFPEVLDAVLGCFDWRWRVLTALRAVVSWPAELMVKFRRGNQ